MAIQYDVQGICMTETPVTFDYSDYREVVQVLSNQEFTDSCANALDRPFATKTLLRKQSSHADLLEACTVGVVALPDKRNLDHPGRPVSFYIDERRLIVIDDTDMAANMLKEFCDAHHRSPLTLARILFYLLEDLIGEDAAYLETFEETLETVEETIADMGCAEANSSVTRMRRELLHLGYYYEQLEDVGELLEDNENELFSDADARLFGLFRSHADRLFQRAGTLKEYSLQLFELQQTQIDVKQNETMRWLTVITSIFVPLTLVTSWYGMNFKYMPELDWVFGYAGVVIICLIIVVIELVIFKRRKWL